MEPHLNWLYPNIVTPLIGEQSISIRIHGTGFTNQDQILVSFDDDIVAPGHYISSDIISVNVPSIILKGTEPNR